MLRAWDLVALEKIIGPDAVNDEQAEKFFQCFRIVVDAFQKNCLIVDGESNLH